MRPLSRLWCNCKPLQMQEKPLWTSASQMLLLLRILPLIIGPEDDRNWSCFLVLLKIVDIVLCPDVLLDICGYLSVLIESTMPYF